MSAPTEQPGKFPFTRGVHATMYRGKLWTMRQYAGFGTAGETNRRYKYLLAQGQTGLSMAFDLPTQIGYDSDHPMALGEVGRVGVAISSLADMERVFGGIPLDKVSTSMTINATASILLAFYLVLAEKQRLPWSKVSGTVQNDILKEYIARGTYIFPPKPSLRLIADIVEFCAKEVPGWNTISVGGYHMREAGCTAAQEIAFTLADGITYVQTCVERGLAVDSFAPRIAFFFNCHSNFFEEVAKFRAARRLWAHIMRDRFGAKNERSMMLRFHTQTAGSSLTAQQPDNNVVRTTLEALAAVLGGTQSLHTNAKDEALALPTEESALLALRTQQIIAYESGVTAEPDPLGGSYYVESLTDKLEQQAREYLSKIDHMGGMLKAIESGYVYKEIYRAAYEHQKAVDKKEKIIVGVNEFVSGKPVKVKTQKIDPKLEPRRRKELAALRKKRNASKVDKCLATLDKAAKCSGNLVPVIIDSVRNYVTLGEICRVLRKEFGEHRASHSI
ncbi:MAG TPA: methylmalonyl-CoA mutase family protein [Verrucomicrobiae bacterium]|nr:methylmalonyl-CoA mutase family protein [Verrucomicrobiae bacterium]